MSRVFTEEGLRLRKTKIDVLNGRTIFRTTTDCIMIDDFWNRYTLRILAEDLYYSFIISGYCWQ